MRNYLAWIFHTSKRRVKGPGLQAGRFTDVGRVPSRGVLSSTHSGLMRAGRRWRAAVWLVLCSTTVAMRAQTYTQTITLNPGWNSVFLEVAPTNSTVSAIFTDPAIVAVAEPKVRLSTVAFIQNQNEMAFNRGGWMVFLPTNRIESLNNDLYNVAANHAYLIKVGGSNTVTVTVTGSPSLRQAPFQADNYTLRGFPVDSSAPPAFQDFFAASPAHVDPASGTLQNIYRLNNANSAWELVNPTDSMNRGVAYWVYTVGASSYTGPLTVKGPSGDGLDFNLVADELSLTLQNNTAAPMNITITDLGAGNRPLAYAYSDTNNPVPSWRPLPRTLTTNVFGGTNWVVRLAVQRSQMTNAAYATVLEVSDGAGDRFRLPVTAQRLTAGSGIAPGGPAAIPPALQAGLWVGYVTVNAIAETYNNATNPTPVKTAFDQRLILHVDTNGTTRLLREVIQMFRNGTYTNNSAGQGVLSQPGQYVLLTDDTLLRQFTGAALRDGTPVGRRISTAQFDFDPPGGTNYLVMTGAFGVSNTVGCTITLTPTTPTNPFLHRYHPDHDNLDAHYQPLASNVPQEVYTVTRQIQLQFTGADPTGQPASDYGYNSIGGVYNETILGIHRNPLVGSGIFHLTRVATTPVLNQ